MINISAALAGTGFGAGLILIAIGLRHPIPDLATTLARLDGHLPDPNTPTPPPPGPQASTWIGATAERAEHAAAHWLHHTVPDLKTWRPVQALHRLIPDLSLLGLSLERFLIRKITYLVIGLAFPPTLTTSLLLIDIHLPWTVPTAAALVMAGVLFLVPDVEVHVRARTARTNLRRAVCVYIELLALERAADAGPTEAVERAAALGDAPAFARIRDALTRARLDGRPPWEGLHALAQDTGVVELGDVADIMASSGRHGTAVYASLRARATSLRTELTAQDTATANTISEHMIIPVALMGLIFMALIAYPALARIVTGA